jgi:hypothetical protein
MYLYYVAEPLQVRLFDSVSKGFVAGDSNLYRYVFNGPTYTTDPTGEIVPIVAAIVAVMEIPATYEGFILLAAGIASVSGAAYVLLNHVAPPTIDINRLIEDFRLKGEWLYGNLLAPLIALAAGAEGEEAFREGEAGEIKRQRQIGEGMTNDDDALEQLEDMERIQKAARDGKVKKQIDDIQKAIRRFKNDMGRIRAPGEAHDYFD